MPNFQCNTSNDDFCGMLWWHGNIFRVTSRRIPLKKASDAELWCFLWSAPEQTVEQTIETLVLRCYPAHHDVTVMMPDFSSSRGSWNDIKHNAWVTVNNLTREVICQWVSRVTKSRVKIVGKSYHGWPKKILIHGNECIILFLTCNVMSWNTQCH